MKIAKISKIADAHSISRQDLFPYLDAVVQSFITDSRNLIADQQIDFLEPLNQVAASLGASRDQEQPSKVEFNHDQLTLNLIDFASFLDTVIRNTAKQNPEDVQLQDLASRNIFRTHINRQVSKQLSDMFFADHLDSRTTDLIDSLSDLQSGLEAQTLFDTMSDASRQHIYIFDIDGVLKQVEENCLTHVVPNLDPQVREDLISLSKQQGNTVLMLTTRTSEAILESNIPHEEIPVITGDGRELINGTRREILVGGELIDETLKFVDHLHTLLSNLGVGENKYLIRRYSGDVQICFIDNSYTQAKSLAMKALRALMQDHSKGWSMNENGSRYISFNKFKCNKAMALKKIIEAQEARINANTNIYVLGDTGSDYKAMEALKEIDLPVGAQAINIAVGNQLKGEPAVDVELSSHHAVADLLSWLAV